MLLQKAACDVCQIKICLMNTSLVSGVYTFTYYYKAEVMQHMQLFVDINQNNKKKTLLDKLMINIMFINDLLIVFNHNWCKLTSAQISCAFAACLGVDVSVREFISVWL